MKSLSAGIYPLHRGTIYVEDFNMDLIDLTFGQELQQDEWSLTAPTFGKKGQLTVVGWSSRGKSGKGHKLYILKCNKCSQESRLFGEGYFSSTKGNLVNGVVPCGCSEAPKWTRDQYLMLCERKAIEIGHTFLGFEGEWKKSRTKIKMLCQKHGEWNKGTVNNLLGHGVGCLECGVDAKTKPADVMIESFFASGAFHPDTKFWRSDRKSKKSRNSYWFMSCPVCGEVGESTGSSLQKGKRSCACSKHRQQECYINWVLDGENPVALKFGVARDSKQRIKQQDSKSAYTLKQHSVYQFSSVQECKQSERECLQELDCGVVLKRDLPDGYTETTWVYNLEKIIEIYERNGGVVETDREDVFYDSVEYYDTDTLLGIGCSSIEIDIEED